MNVERLKKLSDHLRNGQLGHDEFDINTYNSSSPSARPQMRKIGCGSSGCAIGELPIIFPNEWEFRKSTWKEFFDVRLKNSFWERNGMYATQIEAEEWFDIGEKKYTRMFMPSSYEPFPTRYDVADRIDQLIKEYESEQCII